MHNKKRLVHHEKSLCAASFANLPNAVQSALLFIKEVCDGYLVLLCEVSRSMPLLIAKKIVSLACSFNDKSEDACVYLSFVCNRRNTVSQRRQSTSLHADTYSLSCLQTSTHCALGTSCCNSSQLKRIAEFALPQAGKK